MIDDTRHTAIHEAGHAVIGRVVGMVCGYATIRAGRNSSGHAITADPYEIASGWEFAGKFRGLKSIVVGRIMTFQAGSEAEVVALGECPGGDEDDRYQVALMADAGEFGQDKVEKLRRQTRHLVTRHQETIKTVADRLIDLKRLGARQIDLLVWPKARMNGFITFEKLRRRLHGATLEQVGNAMRLDQFPRAYFHNGRIMWRVMDIENLIVRQRQST